MKRRDFLRTAGAAVAAVTLGLGEQAHGSTLAGARPNILLVLTDDQGYGDLGCHGNPIIQTPHLDRFYAQSTRFTDFHASPTCAPTRCSIMTGRHEFRSGVTHTIFERERMSLKATTIAQVLKQAGYATGIFGKWHLGDEDAYQPGQRGFDEVFIHGGGGIGQHYIGSCGDAPGNDYFDPFILHNGVFEKTEGYCTDVFFGQTARWLRERAADAPPFFCYLTPNAPHEFLPPPKTESGFKCPQQYVDLYRDTDLSDDARHFYGMITNLDENFGRLMATLTELNLHEKTLVIFMTDNGSAGTELYNCGMRGRKGTVYEGGTRVPSFWRWPGRIAPDVDVARLTAHVDLFPTFTALAGATPPEGVKLDGRSLMPLLADPRADWPNRYFFTHQGRWPRGKAAGSQHANGAVRDERFKLVNNRELYDLKADPAETTNVIEQYPEEAARLRAVYDQWWNEVLPCMDNENMDGPAINPFWERYFKQFGGRPEDFETQPAGPHPAGKQGK